MAISTKTIERWKGELETNERLLNTKSNRFRWLRRAYVRVYQYLLSRYGDTMLPLPTRDEDPGREHSDHASRMPFIDRTLDHCGLPARSPQSVKNVLEQIHSNQPESPSAFIGEQDRSKTLEWVVVATSQDLRLSSCEIALVSQGIRFRRRASGFHQALEVRFEDRDAAFKVLRNYPLKSLRWTKRDRLAARYSWEAKPRLLLLVWILIASLVACFLVAEMSL